MGTNIEWKARDPERQRDQAAGLANGPPRLLERGDGARR
jgi:hypothetical protein